ncbi:TonB-dependent receptor [Colwellia sp. M166]|uniref:TonB-dependent receptor plug domain-containing protein n=1 Tax=Colwellia sp. M166 TaxID=2583805 RepID=UPI00211EEF65|nr:TonB-dependent receptor [Colwellia sp. M166]UUO22760.1 TonB-dependent receptor [Colwellia sp. M166]|tara:strand:+ start:47790 stop:50369 length:2580 start_codon:yes stop_codon:yes gene_type:complete
MSTKFRTGTLALAVGLALGTAPSFAAESDSKVKTKDIERIAVVGSRSAPRSVAESPVPIDIIGGDELGKNASSDMLDMLQAAVPSFNVRQQPISDAASFIRPVNLRGLSSDSTLILLNGKRRHRASVIAFQGGGVNDGAQGPDISVIPSIALKQVEVLRDGAAAQYGSDAIAGVMNFVLKDDADGGSISVKQGAYYEGDGDTTIVDGNIGLPFTKDGFVNLSFQYKDADATSRSVQRPDAQALIDAGNTSVATPAMTWGNPEIKDDITLFANVGLDLGNDKEFYMFGNYSNRTGTGGYYYRSPHNRGGVFTDGNGDLLVGAMDGNADACPNIPITAGDVRNQQDYIDGVANNDNCWAFNELLPGGYTPQFTADINDTSLTMGTRGEIKGGFLDEALYDISGSVGRNKSTYTLVNTVNPSLGALNADQPGLSFEAGSYIQLEKALNADLVKSVDVGLSEPINVATGFEWRQESFEIVSGEQASWQQGPLATQGFSVGSHGFAGFSPEAQGLDKRQSIAAYLDVEAYVTEDLLLGAALRYEDFSSFGDTTNYKLTAQYRLTDELSVRASHSTGFRAPTVGQANVVNTQTSLVSGELVQSATFPPTHPVSAQKGGVELQPEESVSYAVGLVYQSGDFFMTVDAYNIEVSDRIAQTDKLDITQADVDALAGKYPSPELLLGGKVTFFANDFDTTTQGVDIVANYGMELMGGDTKFSLAYNYNSTEVDDPGSFTTGYKVRRLEEGIPEHRATFTLAQSWENVSMLVRANYFGEWFATHADEPDEFSSYGWSETVGSSYTIDASVSYFLNDSWTLSAGANNIFDTEAQELQKDGGAYGVVSGVYYESGPFDYNGGYYYVKAAYKF